MQGKESSSLDIERNVLPVGNSKGIILPKQIKIRMEKTLRLLTEKDVVVLCKLDITTAELESALDTIVKVFAIRGD